MSVLIAADMVMRCKDADNKAWSSDWIAFQGETPPRDDQALLFDRCTTFEGMHLLKTVGSTLFAELARLGKDELGKAGLHEAVERVANSKKCKPFVREMRSYIRCECRGEIAMKMPR